MNSFKYKGYYYDVETGLYYLVSRYYDPEIGRFISADDPSYLDPKSIGGLNLYSYCRNNPVMWTDRSGCSPKSIWKWIVGGVVLVGTVALVVATGGAALAVGAAIGAWVGAGVGIASGFTLDENGVGFDWDKAATGFMLGSITGAISGAAGAHVGKVFEAGSYAARGIMAGVNGALSLGSYIGQGLINRSDITLMGSLIALGSGLFSFLDPMGNASDYFWGPIFGTEIAVIYDMIHSYPGQSKSQSNRVAFRYI